MSARDPFNEALEIALEALKEIADWGASDCDGIYLTKDAQVALDKIKKLGIE